MSCGYQGAPRPRVLSVGLTDAEVEAIRPLAGSLVALADPDQLDDVHSEEHDVLIATDSGFTSHSHKSHRRIVFAMAPEAYDENGGAVYRSFGSVAHETTRTRTQYAPARDFDILPFAREQGIESLVRRSCIPEPGAAYTGFRTPVSPERVERPFIQEHLANPLVIAAILESEYLGPIDHTNYARSNSSVLWLPDMARSHLAEWARFAFSRWREADPDAFPENAEWQKADEWASPEESSARLALSSFDAAEARRREEAEQQRTVLAGAVETAEQQGGRWRSMLTATGDELVETVRAALEGLGFEVVDSDALPENKGKKREDLRVSDEDWIALVEVKGYGGGAKSNDLQQVTGASAVFAAAERRIPNALWYVVNAFREEDPAQRNVALVGRDDDLTAFAENHNGCLIDTRDLFRLRQLVAAGHISTDEARTELKAASARYVSPTATKSTNSNSPRPSD